MVCLLFVSLHILIVFEFRVRKFVQPSILRALDRTFMRYLHCPFITVGQTHLSYRLSKIDIHVLKIKKKMRIHRSASL